MIYEGFTNRAAWPETKNNIRYYNVDIVTAAENNKAQEKEQGVLPGTEHVGSEVESWVDQLYKISGSRGGLPKQILLTGERGTGKSTILNQAVLHARSRGWICFFVPKGWDYVQSGDFIEPVFKRADGTVVYDNSQVRSPVQLVFYCSRGNDLRVGCCRCQLQFCVDSIKLMVPH
jgi:hypothetical protein